MVVFKRIGEATGRQGTITRVTDEERGPGYAFVFDDESGFFADRSHDKFGDNNGCFTIVGNRASPLPSFVGHQLRMPACNGSVEEVVLTVTHQTDKYFLCNGERSSDGGKQTLLFDACSVYSRNGPDLATLIRTCVNVIVGNSRTSRIMCAIIEAEDSAGGPTNLLVGLFR